MYRLPVVTETAGLDVCFVGVPFDQGASNRSGTRFGPRQVRQESHLVRAFNKETGASPYESLMVADAGDVYLTMYDVNTAAKDIERQYLRLLSTGCKTLTVGGDHTITYPILRAYKETLGPVGLIHIDAHCDVNEHMNHCPIAHGTTFRRALEDGCLDPKRVIQIGMRGTGHSVEDYAWPISQGFRVVPARMCYHKSLTPLMDEVCHQMGNGPVYISFDIDALDPSFAPGTGTPEIGGLTSIQAVELLRGCKGLNIVGGDLVEVSPPYDPSGNTALTAANLLFEMLCVFPGVIYKQLPV
jgi:agmatinase